mmetsp:Transcript_32273/g.47051  ORF Transcript_32273/g.47051 Transcript_32273/m.47051 type:complete len:179 (-) Transcript_32273:114-650(-)
MRHQPSIQTLAVTAITGTVTILTTIYITKSISQYGLSGTLRLLWEGDHLTPECRESMDTLDQVQNKTIPKLGKKLEQLEVTMEVAKLNCVDGPSLDEKTTTTEEEEAIKIQILTQYPKMKTDLSGLSYNLDKAAAKIDSARSDGEQEVKARKKELSNIIVGLMDRADVLIALCGERSQ